MKNNNEAIYGILKSIYEKWRAGTGEDEESEDSEVVSETAVLSPWDIKPTPAGKPEKKEDAPPETVIISTTGAKYSAMPSHEAQPAKHEEVLPETVIMSARDIMDFNAINKKEPDEEKKMKSKKEDYLSETVILNQSDIQDKDKNGNK